MSLAMHCEPSCSARWPGRRENGDRMGTHMCPQEQTGKLSPFRCPPEGGTMCVCVHTRACVLVKWGVGVSGEGWKGSLYPKSSR